MLDFGVVYAAPETGKLLADFGADVIRVESRSNPDLARLAGGAAGMSAQFVTLNRNKRSFGVDLKSEAGRELVRRLVERSDVLIENMARGVLEKLGLGADELRELNPGLVIVSSQLFGRRRRVVGTGEGSGRAPGVRAACPDCGATRTTRPASPTRRRCSPTTSSAGSARWPRWRGSIERRLVRARAQAIRIPQAGAVTNHLSEQFASWQSLASECHRRRRPPCAVGRLPLRRRRPVVRRDDPRRRRCSSRTVLAARHLATSSPTDDLRGRAGGLDVDPHADGGDGATAGGGHRRRQRCSRPTDVLSDPHLVERGFIRVLMQPGWDPLFVEGDCVRAPSRSRDAA